MNTVTIHEAYERGMWQDDDPVLTFVDALNAPNHEHIVSEIVVGNAPGDYIVRCCTCGRNTHIGGHHLLTVTAFDDSWLARAAPAEGAG